MPRNPGRSLLHYGIAAGLMALALLCTGCALRRQLNRSALNPSATFEILPDDYGLVPETLWVPTSGALIHTWLFHAPDPVGTVVICNGNTGNKGLFLPIVPQFIADGYEVALFDYRGFGLSTGKADLYALVDDTAQVIDAVRARAPGRPLALFGTSLGAAIATLVARERPEKIDALVLESMFSPREGCRDIVGKFSGALLCPLVIPGRLEVRRQLPRLSQPILMLHGEGDRISPLKTAATMYREASRRPARHEFWLAAGAGHSPGLLGKYGPVYLNRVREFLETYVSKRAAEVPAATWHFVRSRAGSRTSAGIVEVQFAPEALPGQDETPVEVAVVYASGKSTVRHLWTGPGPAPRLDVPVDSSPLVVSARVIRAPVERDGDVWNEAELSVARIIEKEEQRLHGTLGSKYTPFTLLNYGQPRRVSDTEYEWKPFAGGTPQEKDQKAEQLLQLERDVRDTAAAAQSAEDRARAADLEAQVGAALELYDRADDARESYIAGLDRLPERPRTVVLYGDATWNIGLDETIQPTLNRLIELARTPDERARWVTRLGQWEHETGERRYELARWRMREAATAAPFVDISTVAPAIKLELRYAAAENFLGKAVYPCARCLLRADAAAALTRVENSLESKGLGLMLWDCYRPPAVQQAMWDLVPDTRFVADPKKGSVHSRGGAVDVTLIDASGETMKMPTAHDDFTEKAFADAPASPEATKNRAILRSAMEAEGFVGMKTEWWHFDAAGSGEWTIEDVPLCASPR